jgi:hypothetical protein
MVATLRAVLSTDALAVTELHEIAGNNNTKACNGPRTACTCVGPLHAVGDQRVFLFQKLAEIAEGRTERRGKTSRKVLAGGAGRWSRLSCECVRPSATALNRAAAQHCRQGASAFLLSRSQACTAGSSCLTCGWPRAMSSGSLKVTPTRL